MVRTDFCWRSKSSGIGEGDEEGVLDGLNEVLENHLIIHKEMRSGVGGWLQGKKYFPRRTKTTITEQQTVIFGPALLKIGLQTALQLLQDCIEYDNL